MLLSLPINNNKNNYNNNNNYNNKKFSNILCIMFFCIEFLYYSINLIFLYIILTDIYIYISALLFISYDNNCFSIFKYYTSIIYHIFLAFVYQFFCLLSYILTFLLFNMTVSQQYNIFYLFHPKN